MRKDDLLRIGEQLEMWHRIGFDVMPIDRLVVDETAYDLHIVSAGLEDQYRKNAKKAPWAASGHYGKELNLMLSGQKRVASIGGDSISGWIRHLDDRQFVALIDGPDLDDYVILNRCDLRFGDAILEALLNDAVSAGVVLGYQPDDIARVAQRERKFFAGISRITDEDHEQLLASLELPVHMGFERCWFPHDQLAYAEANGWSHLRNDDNHAWRRNAGTDEREAWVYAMERPIRVMEIPP